MEVLEMFVEIYRYQSVILQTLVAASAILTASCVLKWLTKVQKKNSKYDFPPFVTTGMIDGVNLMASNHVHPLPVAILELCRKHGYKYFQIHMLRRVMLFLTTDFEVCKKILNDRSAQLTPSYMTYKILHDGGDDVFSSEGLFWKHRRKGLAPAFTSAHVRRMNEVGVEMTEDFIDKRLNVFVKTGESFDLFRELLNLTTALICKTAFEYDITDDEKMAFFNNMTLGLTEIRYARIPFRWRFGNFIPTVRRSRQAGKDNVRFGMHILDSYKKLQNPTKGTAIANIVNNSNYKTDKERACDIIMLLFAGYDTTTSTLSWILRDLAMHPVEQDKLRTALRKEETTEARINCLELDCVIKESMRLNPVAPLASGRVVPKDLIISREEGEKDLIVPKGSAFAYCPYIICRNKDIYEDPDVYRPSRWVSPSEEAINTLQPFSIGRRSCLGKNLALSQIRNILAMMCSEFEFQCDDEGTPTYATTYRPLGCRLTAKKAK